MAAEGPRAPGPPGLRVTAAVALRLASEREQLAPPAAGQPPGGRADQRAADRVVPRAVPLRHARLERGGPRSEQLHVAAGAAGEAALVLRARVQRRLGSGTRRADRRALHGPGSPV